MTADGKSDQDIARILAETRTIAMIGASNNPARASYGVLRFLIAEGYQVFPINPGLAGKEIHGTLVYASLADLPAPVDMVDVFRNSEAAGEVIDETIALPWHPKVIWLQLEIINEAAAARARAAGIEMVMDRCPAIEIPRLGGRVVAH